MFISFEGVDGCGKSLMQKLCAKKLKALGYDVVTTREPGGSDIGKQIRKIILDSPYDSIDDRTETLLYAADRSLHVAKVIKPALEANSIVLCDRYVDSSYAYQGSGRKLGLEDIKTINNFAIDELLPDITFLLNLPLDVAQSRLRGKKDRLEQEDIDFFIRTSQAYLQLAQDNPERFVIIDATQPIPKELNQIMDVILSRLKTN